MEINKKRKLNKKASMGLKGLIIAFLLIGAYAVALFSFGVQFALDNDANQTILDDYRTSHLNESLDPLLRQSQTTANTSRSNLEQESIDTGGGFFMLGSIVSSAWSGLGIAVGIYNVILEVISITIGIPTVILSVIAAILLITGGFLFWRVLKRGD